jgi:glycine/D-amino acid oxidase-like deaminating enzyme
MRSAVCNFGRAMAESFSRDAGALLQIHFEDEPLSAAPGETVAATLVAHGRLALSTDKVGDSRGVYCGMGVCHDCLVTIDGRPGQRACLVKATAGMRVKRQAAGIVTLTTELADLAIPPRNDLPERPIEVVVIGAGPGGLAAALAARRAGAEVLILDERPAPGGQFYKQLAYISEPRDRPDRQARDGRALIDKVRVAGAIIEGETLVWGAARDNQAKIEIMTLAHGQIGLITPKIVVIATGAYERPIVVPGWTLPGVMTTGAAQTLKRSYNVSPGRRLLIAGNGPLNFQVAAELSATGAKVTVIEAADAPWLRPIDGAALFAADARLALQGVATIARLKRAHAAIHWRSRLIAIEGDGRAERAIVAPLAANGRIQRERSFAIPVDAVLTGDGFWPASELPRLLGCPQRAVRANGRHLEAERSPNGATSLEDVFIVGEAGAFGGAHVALAQGELAGVEAARRLGYEGPDTSSARRRLAHHHRFQTALWRLFATPQAGLALAQDDTLICRCESVTLGALRKSIAKHAVRDIATLKRLTRAGMGRCQGRYCAPHLVALISNELESEERDWFAPQMPLRPIPLAALAIERPEWGGHKHVLLPPLSPSRADQLDIREAEILVIGAGIVGLSTALFLARAGQSVVVLDHAQPNSGASGANAGSLHAQLLSFDYGAKAQGYVGLAAKTLPLQAESIRLWQKLAQEFDTDLEIKITGGLMLAETERDLAFLSEKARIERAQGVECEIIGAADLRKLEPALNETFLGAAYCAQEGKINPLIATQRLLDAAIAAGAKICSAATVTGIEITSPGFSIETSRGRVKARRVVNAAGAFASQIGAMVGVKIPVFGAPLQMIVTEAAEPTISSLIAHADRHLTLKQAANGNFIIGGGWTAGLDPVHHRPRPLRASLEGNLWVAQHVVPSLRKLHVIRSWAAMNIDIDGAPIVGEHPAIPGFFNAVTSNGYTLGPIMGLTTAELMVSGRAERDISSFGIDRFGRN